MGRSNLGQDLDATTDARPDHIRALVADLADSVWLQGERFGTVGCVIAGQSYEITTHRAESYEPGSRRPTVVFGDDVSEDLARRDFTVNAMAIDMADHSLVDPFGGRADLDAGVLRTPLAPEVSLSEDPLRMLRAARFAAGLGLSVAPELLEAMAAEAGRLEIVSVERVRDELQKLLMLDDPGAGLRLIDETGLGRLVPVVGAVGSWESAARRVRAVRQDPAMRWAAMLSLLREDPAVESQRGQTLRGAAAMLSLLREDPAARSDWSRIGGGDAVAGSGVGGGDAAVGPEAGGGDAVAGSGVGGGDAVAGSVVGGGDAVGRSELRLGALKFSGAMTREVKWFLGEGGGLLTTDLASLADSRFRGLARACPAGRRVEDLLAFVAGLRVGDGRAVDDVEAASARLARLRRREPDLDDPVPVFAGLEVADLLGIEPSPVLGEAMKFLAELRVAEGPLGTEAAARRLRAWWSENQSS